MIAATGAGRWAQLSYGSLPADPVARTPAGWRVKESVGGLSDEEANRLVSLAVTRFESHVPFPGVGQRPEVYQALPRRFGYVWRDDQAFYWHASQLDVDGSGRTGNVFSHLVLDRLPDSSAPRHAPVALWRSEQFLAPHQYALLAGESLPADAPGPGPVVTRENLLTFLFDPAQWRVGTLAVLADAVIAALQGGPRVVLRCDDQAEAALWIGAVSALLSLRDARRLGFSLYERGASEHSSGVEQAFERGVHVAAVPAGDVLAPSDTIVEIDPSADVSIGEPGGSHTFADGRRVDVGVVSSLVTLCLFTEYDARALFDGIDQVARRTDDAPTIDPAWPLAMTILLLSDQYPDAAALARPIVVRATPEKVAVDDELRRTTEAAMGHELSDDPALLWGQLRSTPRESFTSQLLAGTYLARAVEDTAWLTQASPAPLPEIPLSLERFSEAAAAALDVALARAASGGASLSALRLIGFVGGVFAQRAADPAVESRLDEFVAGEIDRLVDDPRAASILADAGAFDDAVLERWIIPALEQREPAPDSLFTTPPVVLIGLFGPSPLFTPGTALGRTIVQWDAATLAVTEAPDFALEREVAVHLLHRFGRWDRVPEEGKSILLLASRAWNGSHLVAATEGDLTRVPEEVAARAILRSSRAEALAVAAAPPSAAVGLRNLAKAVVEARRVDEFTAGGALLTREEEARAIVACLETMQNGPGRPHDRSQVFGPAIAALSIVVRSDGREHPELEPHAEIIRATIAYVSADRGLTARVAPYVDARAGEDAVRAVALIVHLAFLGAASTDPDHLTREQRAWCRLTDANGNKLVDDIAERALRSARRANAVTADDIALALETQARMEKSRADKVARQWWRSHASRGAKVVDNGVEFLGGLFRGRQKEEG